jgi:hypothetical protein
MSNLTHLISYSLHHQPHSAQIEADSQELTPEQARTYLNAIHPFEWPNEITNVQVTRISHSPRDISIPASRSNQPELPARASVHN